MKKLKTIHVRRQMPENLTFVELETEDGNLTTLFALEDQPVIITVGTKTIDVKMGRK